MLSRIVVGVKRLDVDRPVLGLVISLASETGGEVHVVHVRQQRCSKGGPSYDETMEDASRVVEQAVFELRMAGIGTNGKVTSTLEGRVARSIMEQADLFAADVIVVGCRKHHGLHRLFGNSDRDTLVRLSSVPVLLAPVESSQRPTDGAGELAGPRDLAP
jgi:nucleotide-binding universal stress UspA family protein